jgi:hypothetical protein
MQDIYATRDYHTSFGAVFPYMATYFTFCGEFYNAARGGSYGITCLTSCGNIYMEMVQKLALRTAQNSPRMWKRHVDDTFCVMDGRHVEEFLNHRPRIVTCNTPPTIHTTSNEGWFPPYFIGSGLSHMHGENQNKEEEHLTQVLRDNGYPCELIRSVSQPSKGRVHEEDPRHMIYIPYATCLGEDLRWVCRRHNVRTIFKSLPTLRHQLCRIKDKDPIERSAGVVYEIPCACGQTYVGETKRALGTRLKEHQAATRRGEIHKSAIAEHAWTHKHQLSWAETRILDHARNTSIFRIKEAIHILLRNQRELKNRDWGVEIDGWWR